MHRGEEVWGNVMDNGHEDTSRIVVRTPLKSVGKKMAAVNGIDQTPKVSSFSWKCNKTLLTQFIVSE